MSPDDDREDMRNQTTGAESRAPEEIAEKLRVLARAISRRLAREQMDPIGPNPDDHAAFIARCHDAGQTRPTPLLLQYGKDDYNCPHQDLYGERVFLLQIAILLSEPGKDLEGGEFVLTEQRPRMQSLASVVPLTRGDAVVCSQRPSGPGARGFYRTKLPMASVSSAPAIATRLGSSSTTRLEGHFRKTEPSHAVMGCKSSKRMYSRRYRNGWLRKESSLWFRFNVGWGVSPAAIGPSLSTSCPPQPFLPLVCRTRLDARENGT